MPNDIQRFKLNHAGILVPDDNGFTRDQINAGLTTPIIGPATTYDPSGLTLREYERDSRRARIQRKRLHGY